MIAESIKKVMEKEHLSEAQMVDTFECIMEGRATAAQIGAFLVALRLKGETEDEIVGAARVMREKATKVNTDLDVIDTCGTGGDGRGTFNISTAVALVAAGAGLKVAKHGNRAASSICGSADVLEVLGVNVDLEPERVGKCITEAGIGFMFAPRMHAAMKHAIGPRREIGVRTVFNVLGPLTNPAGAKMQLIGVFSPELTEVFARVLNRLGCERAMVVHGCDGIDEITLSGPTRISELKDGWVKTYCIDPEEHGLKTCGLEALEGGTPERNAEIIRGVLSGTDGPHRDVVLLNAAAALVVGGVARDFAEGLEAAAAAVDSGAAAGALEKMAAISNA